MQKRRFNIFFILSIFLITYGYAFVRYHLGKELLELIHIPFVLNKAIAWTAGTYLVLSLIPDLYLRTFNVVRRELGMLGYLLAVIHICSGILLLRPNLYPKFYTDEVLNNSGWIYISFGVCALIAFSLPLYASLKKATPSDFRFRFGKLGIVMVLFHVIAIDLPGWLEPLKWPLFLPPITLLFAVYTIVVITIRIFYISDFTTKED
jgi:hypothetical protein